MASLRDIKKDIDYVVNEVAYDCFLSIQFHPAKQEEIINIMQEAVDLRNNLFEMVNNPSEKNNPSLVRKHYAFIRAQLLEKADELWAKLSDICKAA